MFTRAAQSHYYYHYYYDETRRAGANSRLQKQAGMKEEAEKKKKAEHVDEMRTGSEETKQPEGGLFSKRYASSAFTGSSFLPFAFFFFFFCPRVGVPQEWYVYTGFRLAARV